MKNPHLTLHLTPFVASADISPLAPWLHLAPWEITSQAAVIVRKQLQALDTTQFRLEQDIAIHITATVEPGAVLKGPLIIGAGVHVASGAYLRGGCWIGPQCIIGPGTEVKSSFVFDGSKLAHFNFVGDSIVGRDVNLEAGSVICNFRNERADKEIFVRIGEQLHNTGHHKFGAVLGDHARIGANAVLAPGALLEPGSLIARASLYDAETL